MAEQRFMGNFFKKNAQIAHEIGKNLDIMRMVVHD